jgi:two-component system LytT family sensor kinase
MGMKTPSSSSRWRLALVVVAAALGFSVLEVALARLRYSWAPMGAYWVTALWHIVPSWLIPAALLPAVAALSRAAPVDRTTWRASLPLHVLAAVAFTVIHLGGTAGLRAWRGESFESVFVGLFSRYAVVDLFMYGAIVAVLQAHHFQSELREREIGLARARLQVLRAQLQPHFLFNSLNAIAAMALNGERERVALTVSSLSELLRRSLDDSIDHEVPLETEMELLDHYLRLEKTRFEDRLSLESRVAPEALRALVPSLLLQPLVENAVRHGIERRRGPGRVVIEAAREGPRLRVEVRDSGPGFADAADAAGRGIGLANTQARLEQLYGPAHSLERGVAPEGGARVTIRLPFRAAGNGS